MLLSAVLFAGGITLILFRKPILWRFLGIELCINGAFLNLWLLYPSVETMLFILVNMAIAVAESALFLALVYYGKAQSRTL